MLDSELHGTQQDQGGSLESELNENGRSGRVLATGPEGLFSALFRQKFTRKWGHENARGGRFFFSLEGLRCSPLLCD